MTIKKVEQCEEVLRILNAHQASLFSLSSGRADPKVMAKKFLSYATVLECTEDGNSVGFCAFYHNDRKSKSAFLSMIAVNPAFEGKGYASGLLSMAEQICLQSGMASISLEVRNENLRAIRFYLKHHYSVVACHPTDDILLMSKELRAL